MKKIEAELTDGDYEFLMRRRETSPDYYASIGSYYASIASQILTRIANQQPEPAPALKVGDLVRHRRSPIYQVRHIDTDGSLLCRTVEDGFFWVPSVEIQTELTVLPHVPRNYFTPRWMDENPLEEL